ncbi:hypothetical protein INS49_004698 [Diaporthe citri]|uniref:uncharacterized protein n=1 Tax=Diaporthe citri TaxID=83186 RepID=UPI001C804B2A|nr:uncharacterized protein INS49_004698 [Diaporthe citri]KAG6354680.1 hypothetical protein INS49_004698 [Diaporthe citri]
MTRKTTGANEAWEDSASRGEMNWLKDTAFVAADCFLPPSNYQPHTWERIAVPPATSSHGRGRIYKRVPGRSVDVKYNVVAAELDSQGFDMRKRVRMTNHKSAWGLHSFDPRYETAMNVQDEIEKARDQVKSAYKQIAQDNDTIRKNARPAKRSTYDPSSLMCTPRKRHNSRWPVTPPTWEAMIAEWQPLIVFEIDISEIDDPAFWEQENAMALQQHEQNVQRLTGKRSKKRRSIVQRPSLSTISEERKEPSGVPAKYRPMYSAPSKRWAAAAEKYFTITATPTGVTVDDAEGDESSSESSEIEITNHRGQFRVPSSPLSSRSATTAASNRDTQGPVEVTNERGRFRVPSSPLSSRSASTTASNRKRRAQNDDIDQRCPVRRRSLARESSPSPTRPTTDSTAVAVFDQPTPKVHTEPEHETKRRVSLDNARRSDRPLQMTAFKKVRTWAASTFTGRRRSFAEVMEEQEEQDKRPRTRRRHTLDVDVGRNPDIFGQTAGREQELLPRSDALRSTAPQTTLPGPITQTETQAEDAPTSPIENGTTSIGSGAAKNIDDGMGNRLSGTVTLAAQEDSLSEVDTEFSMARNASHQETAAPLEDSATPHVKKTVGIDWNAITNVDDKIRDLLDRKADLVFNKDIPVGKDDDGDTLLSDGDETQPFEESVLNRIMSVLESDEDEDITMGGPDFDTLAPKLHVANPPAAGPFMADSPVGDSPAADSPVLDSPLADLPTAMEMSVDEVSNTAMADVHVSEELAALPQPVEASEHDVATTTVESAAMIDTPVPEELGATSQPLAVSDDGSHAATIIEHTAIGDTSIPDEPPAIPQSAEAPYQNLDGATPDEPMPIASTSDQPVTTSQSDEAGDRASHAGEAAMPTAQPQTVEAQDGDPNDDSQLEMLHSFVRRAQMKPKRRESMTLFTGSPKAHVDPSIALKSPRQPLGQKDANMSPSPGKKRKLKEVEEAPLDMTKTSRLVKPDLEDTMPQPLRKRRRKGSENDSPDEIFNPDMAMSQSLTQRGSSGGPRRSKRVATTKPAEPVTPSHIPVRLPGSFDADMPAISTAGLMQRKTEKDLATLTRTNTRRNKGPALPVPARLAGLSLPADAAADPFVSPDKAAGLRASRRGKSVRWDETLARFQGDDGGNPPAAVAATTAGTAATAVPAVVEEATTPGPVPVTAPATSSVPASAPPESEKKKALRPRPSRLPAAVTKTATTPKTAKTPKPKAAATPSRVTPTPTRRSGALGARLGTPAAKRRGSART